MNLLVLLITLNCCMAAADAGFKSGFKRYNYNCFQSVIFIFDSVKQAGLFNSVISGILVSGLMLSLSTMISSSKHFLLSLNISIILILQSCIFFNYFYRPSENLKAINLC